MREDWVSYKLGNIFHTASGGTPSRKNDDYFKGSILWVKSGELGNGAIFDTEEKITEEAIKNSSAKIFPKGTLLIALYGATIGKLAFLGVDAATNQAVCGIYENDNIDSKFLYNFLLLKRPKLISQGTGGAQSNISQTILKKLEFPFPSLSEQRAIVQKIESYFALLDKGIADLTTAQEQLKTYRQAVLKKAFEGEYTMEWRKKNKWSIFTFEEITESLKRGPFGGDLKKEYFVENGYAVYEQQHAINNDFTNIRYFINEERYNLLKACIANPGDYIVSCSGTIGKIARIPEGAPKGVINQALLRIRINEKTITHKYFIEFFRSHIFQKMILRDSRGSGMQNMAGVKEIKSIKINLPSIEEQQVIVREIESRLSVCDKVEQSISEALEKAEALRQSILKKAFEGGILSEAEITACKQEPDYEPASVLLERIKKEEKHGK